MEDNIFNQEQHPNEATAAIAKKHNSLTANSKALQNNFHDLHKEASREPDWSRMLMQAQSQQAKMQIRAAREVYEEEAKYKAWEAVQQVQDAKISSILSRPTHERNKQFYDDLQRNNPVAFWDVRIQAQKRRDKGTAGLGWHLKGGK
jgi:hypothetical protein